MRFVSIDTETELIAPGKLAPPSVCLSWADDGGAAGLIHTRLEKKKTLEFLKRVLRDTDTIICGANIAYDIGVLVEDFSQTAPWFFEALNTDRVYDVQLNQQLYDIGLGQLNLREEDPGVWVRTGYSLASLEQRLLDRDRSAEKGPDTWRMRYSELADVPLDEWPKEASAYAIADAEGTLQVFQHQMKNIEMYLENAAAQCRANVSLHLMSCWGVHTDPVRIREFKEVAEAEYVRLTNMLLPAGLLWKKGTKKKPTISKNTKAAKARLLDLARTHNWDVKLTKTGRQKLKRKSFNPNKKEQEAQKDHRVLSLNIEDVQKMKEQYVALDAKVCRGTGDPLLMAYGERTSIATDVNSRIPDLEKGVETPIQATYTVLVDSGRTSCSKGKLLNGFQMQNPPRKGPVRECFVARPGYLFADADFDGLELRTMAQVCHELTGGKSKLADALNAGLDPHLSVGAQLLGISYKEAVAERRDKRVKDARQLGKVANFGFPGGLQPLGFLEYASGYGLHTDLASAEKIFWAWGESWPEFQVFFNYARGYVDNERPIRQFYSNRFRGGCSYTAACNTLFQGLGADGAKEACWRVTEAAYNKTLNNIFYGARPAIFVHDQIISEVREDIAHEQATEMARLMVEGCNKFLPDVPATCTAALSKHWCKDVEDVYDQRGRLVPWDIYKAGGRECYYRDGKQVQW